jgi:hypothetical protein
MQYADAICTMPVTFRASTKLLLDRKEIIEYNVFVQPIHVVGVTFIPLA